MSKIVQKIGIYFLRILNSNYQGLIEKVSGVYVLGRGTNTNETSVNFTLPTNRGSFLLLIAFNNVGGKFYFGTWWGRSTLWLTVLSASDGVASYSPIFSLEDRLFTVSNLQPYSGVTLFLGGLNN